MNNKKRSNAAAAGWLVTLTGVVALATLAYSILSTSYRRERLLSLLEGNSTVDGIGIQSWLLLASPLLVIGLGIALIAAAGARSPAR